MAKGGRGLPKVSPEPIMSNPSMPYKWITLETASQPYQGWRFVAVFCPFGHPTPYAMDVNLVLMSSRSRQPADIEMKKMKPRQKDTKKINDNNNDKNDNNNNDSIAKNNPSNNKNSSTDSDTRFDNGTIFYIMHII
jgi:hypothetical protein